MVMSTVMSFSMLLNFSCFVANLVMTVAVWVMRVVDVMEVVDLPILCPVEMLLVVMVDHEVAMGVREVVIVMVNVLFLMSVDQVLLQMGGVLAEQMRVNEGVVDGWNFDIVRGLVLMLMSHAVV